MKPCPRRATRSSGFIVPSCQKTNRRSKGQETTTVTPDPPISCRRRCRDAGLQRLAGPRLGVPSERLALLHRLECQEARERSVVADLEFRVRLLPGLDAVEEVPRVDVERVVFLHAALGIHIKLRFDGRHVVAAPAAATTSAWP